MRGPSSNCACTAARCSAAAPRRPVSCGAGRADGLGYHGRAPARRALVHRPAQIPELRPEPMEKNLMLHGQDLLRDPPVAPDKAKTDELSWPELAILVVDDEEGMRSFLQRALTPRCARVEVAADVE